MISNPQHELWWGDVLIASGAGPTELTSGCMVQVVADGFEVGSTQPALTVVRQLLDGSRVDYDGDDNCQVKFTLEFTAGDSAQLAEGLAEIDGLIGQPSSLAWVEPDDFAAPTVFDVETSTAERAFDDMDALRVTRLRKITLYCQPFVRPLEKVSVPAITSATSTTIDTCDSTTGWVAGDGTLSVVAGAVVQTRPRNTWSTLTRTGAVDMTGTPYLVVEWSSSFPVYFSASATADGSGLWPEVRRDDVGGGWYRSTFHATTLITSSGIRFGQVNGTDDPASGTFSIRNVARSSVIGGLATDYQQALTVNLGGTVRALADIHVSHPTSGLGTVFLHSSPAGSTYLPPLSVWSNGAGAAENATPNSISGTWKLIDTEAQYDVPARMFADTDEVVFLVARLIGNAVGSARVDFSSQSLMAGAPVGDRIPASVQTYYPTASEWYWQPLGVLPAPPSQVGLNGEVRFTLQKDAAESTPGLGVYVDEILAFRVGRDCALTWLSPGGANHLWIDAPQGSQRPGLWCGDAADRSDAVSGYSTARMPGAHVMHPRGTSIFLVSDSALGAKVDVEGFPRFRDMVV